MSLGIGNSLTWKLDLQMPRQALPPLASEVGPQCEAGGQPERRWKDSNDAGATSHRFSAFGPRRRPAKSVLNVEFCISAFREFPDGRAKRVSAVILRPI